MKTVSLPVEGLSLERLLQEASGGDVVFLTANGQVRFALVPAEEGDEEIHAIRSNSELMAYLAGCAERARTGPRKSLQQIRDKYGSSAATATTTEPARA
jgi:hypothetical protein